MMRLLVPDSGGMGEFGESERLLERTRSGAHIHTEKFRRCVKHVQSRKGGSAYNAYAVCMSSIGPSGSLLPGHRRSSEADRELDAVADELVEMAFSKAPLGSGGRFAACKAKMAARGNVSDPAAVCAAIGRRKYGKAGFAKLSAKGRRG